jgi:hypothetical protein
LLAASAEGVDGIVEATQAAAALESLNARDLRRCEDSG